MRSFASAPFCFAVTLLKSNVLPDALVIVSTAPFNSLEFAASTLLMLTVYVLATGLSKASILVPVTITVSSSLTVVSVTFPPLTVNVAVVNFSYSVSPILRVTVSSNVYDPLGRLSTSGPAELLDFQVIAWGPLIVTAGPLTRVDNKLTMVPAFAVSFMEALSSSVPFLVISCLLIETSVYFFLLLISISAVVELLVLTVTASGVSPKVTLPFSSSVR